MHYDTSSNALFHPELLDPLPMTRAWQTDAVAAEVSRLAYFRIENDAVARGKVERALDQIGYSHLQSFPGVPVGWIPGVPDPQAFAAVTDQGRAIIAFRGTQPDSIADLLSDLLVPLVSWKGVGRVHVGFRQALDFVLADIQRWIDQTAPSELLITGHSLGAAMATLLAGLYPSAELVTFGSPRVGNSTFAAALGARRVRRYVDHTDIVAHVPVKAPLFGYRHTSGRRDIDANGRIVSGPDRDDGGLFGDLTAVGLLRRRSWQRDRLPRWLTDHAPINYVSAVAGMRE